MSANQQRAITVAEFSEQVYREDASRIMASLLRIFGHHNIDLAEDIMQDAFHKALIHWEKEGIPDNPRAWLIQTAKRKAIDRLRAQKTHITLAEQHAELLKSEWSMAHTVELAFTDEHFIQDEQLRMIFACCDPNIRPQNQIPFILRVLCGLSLRAIASALMLPEETVKKRIARTKQAFKTSSQTLPDAEHFQQGLQSVHTVLYLLFNEGYYSSEETATIKLVMCREAISLLQTTIEVAGSMKANKDIVSAESMSLLALMHFHLSRADARFDTQGRLIPLNLQNRQRWQQEKVLQGMVWLRRAEQQPKERRGRFFYEARIAEHHCTAAEFADTDWSAIAICYRYLIEITDSDLVRLHYAIALGYRGDVLLALEQVNALMTSPLLKHSHLLDATLAHLYAMQGERSEALFHAERSTEKGGSDQEQTVMYQQIERLLVAHRAGA
ncbi:RNA polymerase sigma factor [Thaumasiovibrio subtropicus]|uniref:RNA polymerase sigma factor n=1 Tax=Thaumasiovibrio subtropicus TaxID=1891207 RepID=UPI001FE3805F|nr:sigma-70 family RNA polymerase sigma factor [Thaumasiovibrio subtropicus]